MNLHELMAEDVGKILTTDELGYAGVYKHYSDGTEQDITVILDPRVISAQIRGYSIELDTDLIFAQLDFPPQTYDEVTADGDTWVVQSYEIHGAWTALVAFKNRVPTGTKTGFR